MSRSAISRLARSLTLHRLLTVIVFVAIFTMATRTPADTDTWWQLGTGRWIVEHRAVPSTDPFSHTRYGQKWVSDRWLSQVIYYLLFESAGYAGLAVMVATLATVAFYFVWLQCQTGDRWLRAFVLIIAAATSGVIWAARPQMFTLALAAIYAYLLHRFRQGERKALWWLPPIMAVWVNLHGGFAVGFILLAATLFGAAGNWLLRQDGVGPRGMADLALVTLACALVLPLNPSGFGIWKYPFQTVEMQVLRDFIVEWRSPDLHQMHVQPFVWMLLAVLTALGLSGRRANFTDLTLVALFTYMSLFAARNIALFALVTPPVIVNHASAALSEWRERMGWIRGPTPIRPRIVLNWILLLLVVVAAGVKISQPLRLAINEQATADILPVEAVSFLKTVRPEGPIFNSYNWGGYLIWALPEYPVFVDGRTDLYNDEILSRYLAIVLAQDGWQQELNSFGVNLVLIEPQSLLGRMLALESGWKQVYRDSMSAVFVRQ